MQATNKSMLKSTIGSNLVSSNSGGGANREIMTPTS